MTFKDLNKWSPHIDTEPEFFLSRVELDQSLWIGEAIHKGERLGWWLRVSGLISQETGSIRGRDHHETPAFDG